MFKNKQKKFPGKLEVLTPLEERLISPSIPIMQIHELPREGQLSSHGNIVNLRPSDVNSTVHSLLRPISRYDRHLSYKHYYQFQNVRPERVPDAAKYLVDTEICLKVKAYKCKICGYKDSIILQTSASHED